VKRYWEIITDNLSKSGWSWGCVATVDRDGRAIWVVAADRDGQRFIVHADEMLTAFLELQCGFVVNLNSDEILGDHCGQPQQGRLELGLFLGD